MVGAGRGDDAEIGAEEGRTELRDQLLARLRFVVDAATQPVQAAWVAIRVDCLVTQS